MQQVASDSFPKLSQANDILNSLIQTVERIFYLTVCFGNCVIQQIKDLKALATIFETVKYGLFPVSKKKRTSNFRNCST